MSRRETQPFGRFTQKLEILEKNTEKEFFPMLTPKYACI